MDKKILFTDYCDNLDIKVNGLLVHSKFSNTSLERLSNDKVLEAIELIHSNDMCALVSMDRLIEEDELKELKDLIDLIIRDCDYILYSDYAVYNYIYEKYNGFGGKLIYNPRTLVCNIYEFNHLETSAIVSNELTLDAIKDINDYFNPNLKKYLGIKVFGFHQMFYSKRELISAYNDYFNKDIKKNKFYDLKEENRNDFDKIIETDFGTLIFYGKPLVIYNELKELDEFKFFYINSELFDLEKIKIVCDCFYELLFNDNNKYDQLISIVPNFSKGFLDKNTVLIKGDDDE